MKRRFDDTLSPQYYTYPKKICTDSDRTFTYIGDNLRNKLFLFFKDDKPFAESKQIFKCIDDDIVSQISTLINYEEINKFSDFNKLKHLISIFSRSWLNMYESGDIFKKKLFDYNENYLYDYLIYLIAKQLNNIDLYNSYDAELFRQMHIIQ